MCLTHITARLRTPLPVMCLGGMCGHPGPVRIALQKYKSNE
jgi:hypothetical protein